MLKKILVSLLLVLSVVANAQLEHSHWSTEVEYLDDGDVKVKVIADVDEHWHISSLFTPDGGISPTSIEFDEENGKYELTKLLKEPTPTEKYEEVFEVNILFHEGPKVVFEQVLSANSKEDFDVNISVFTQTCHDEEGCIPKEFTLTTTIDVDSIQEESLMWLFIAGFAAGLLALLTPCVFPMIPMTVTFFTKMAESKSKGIANAFIYGISIVVIYVALGFGVSSIVNEEAIYMMASSVSFNLVFFAVFTLFAISFLGAFELTLPASLTNKIDAKADKGGLIGVFFMAFTLALVSFSCTGPVIGTLIIEAAMEGGVRGPLMGMLGFGVALALPFTLFAIFPSGLKKLPKSGGWLNAVKVVLGLLELALAMKFLSNADIVVQAEYITREIFIAFWIVIFGVMGVYLLGKLRLPHDSPMEKLSVSRLIMGIITLSFVVYMIPGMFGAPLKMLSGVLPPSFYTEGNWSGPFKDAGNSSVSHSDSTNLNLGEHKEFECPNGLDCYHDYDEALQAAKEQGKPLFIDFTGWTCTNCRLMEQNVWSDKAIDKMIRNDYVLVSLYSDDRTELPENEKYISKRTGETVETYGGKVRDFQIEKYGKLAMPFYVLVDHNEKKLVPTRDYDIDVDAYKNWLKVGLLNFKKKASNLNTKNNENEKDTLFINP